MSEDSTRGAIGMGAFVSGVSTIRRFCFGYPVSDGCLGKVRKGLSLV